MSQPIKVIEIEKNSKSFRTPERPTSVHKRHIYVWEKDNSCKQDTLMDISVYIYRFMYRYTEILYITLLMNCTYVYTTHINGTHTRTLHSIYIDSCTNMLNNCTHLLQMDCICVYTTVHSSTTWHYLNIY